MKVLLVHGMGRTRTSMTLLARRLSGAGFRPSTFGYRAWQDSLDHIVTDFTSFAWRKLDGETDYAIVGHSLGNVITRIASPRLPPGFRRFAMLAPPNRSPALARLFRRSPTFRLFTGDAGRKLASRKFMESLPRPDVPTLVIAGETRAPWLPFRGGPSDGVVSVAETELEGALHRTYDATHTFIMNDPRITRDLVTFLKSG